MAERDRISYKELFPGRRSGFVLIEGNGGTGKSTLCRKYSYDWAIAAFDEDAYFVQDFRVLFLLEGCHFGKVGLEHYLNEFR